jgi:hypothetical protein
MFCYYVFTIINSDSKTNMKSKTLHRHLHPIHWHGSMVVAIAALLLTSVKCSGEMLRALHSMPVHQASTMESIYLRDAETSHMPIILSSGVRHATFSGR